ncbi:hypothetical protein ACT80S_01970 [Ramlibacter sp. MAHUQ-53]|uniref:hypothetical protein n=1 Tax=unclassified Ramlibacter TaxID=2617605 RepID=UPI00362F52E5
MTPRLSFAALCAAAFLSACGGGGVEPSGRSAVAPEVSRKYAGVWHGCRDTAAGPSFDELRTFERVSDTVLRATYRAIRFEVAGCQGAGTGLPEAAWHVQLLGPTREIDGVVLDEVIESAADLPARKSLLGVDDAGFLRVALPQPVGADGYPTGLAPAVLKRP